MSPTFRIVSSVSLMLLLLMLSLQPRAASITISGNISSNTVWSADTIKVVGDVTINNTYTLTIDPGVVVLLMGQYAINVQGRLLALGVAGDSICFTPQDTATGWGGLRFVNTPITNDSSILEYCIIEYGITSGDGGGFNIYNFSKLRISHSCIRNCDAVRGGGMLLWFSSPRLNNNTLCRNKASFGGGMHLYVSSAALTNNFLSGNTAENNGGGMQLSSSSPGLTNNTLSGNTSDYGGGMCLQNSNPVMNNNILSGNAASSGGGMCLEYSNPTMNNNTLCGNTAGGGGGMIMIFSNPSLINNTLSGNTADFGGGMNLYDSSPMLINSILWGNEANAYSSIYQGGSSTPVITYSNIQGGFSGAGNLNIDPLFVDAAGGDYRLQPASPCINTGTPDTTGLGLPATDMDGNPRILGCRIEMGAYENTANAGGDILTDQSWASDTVYVHCDVNIADSATLTITPGVTVLFMGHYAINVQGRILALGAAGDSIRFTPQNTTAGWGGIRFDNTPPSNDSSILEYCIIEYGRNPAGTGGGIYWHNMSEARLSNSLVQNNFAGIGGGIGITNNAHPRIIGNVIRNNSARDYAGGAEVNTYSAPIFIGNSFLENAAEGSTGLGYGGGMRVQGNSYPLIQNNLFKGNYAAYGGGGIYLRNYCHPVLLNNTIVDNNGSMEGGGIRMYDGNYPSISNCIIWGNTSSVNPSIHNLSNGLIVVSYSDVQGAWPGLGNLNEDPLFADPSTDDYSLQYASPCINTGTPDTTGLGLRSTDLIGNRRVVGCVIDMGAFENQAAVTYHINANTTWSADTVRVYCEVDIDNGATLTIDPGVTVLFMGYYAINVQGRILALGAPGDSIRFTPQDTTVGWGGIRFDYTPSTNDSSILEYCVIEYAKRALLNTNGGGLYLHYVDKFRLTSSRLSHCQAGAGGGIYLSSSSPVLTRNIISMNTVGYVTSTAEVGNGAGIFFTYSSPVLIGNLFVGNWAGYSGGAISMSGSIATLTNNTMSGNEAFNFGGAIYMRYSTATLTNNTMIGNEAFQYGGAISIWEATVTLTNNILWGNIAPTDSSIYNIFGNLNVNFSNIQGGWAGTGNLNTDPLFVDAANGNYRLQPISPCINTGTMDTIGLGLPSTDLDGNPRIHSCAIDMGAYENQDIAGGPITSDTTWASDTVYVHCDVDIANGATLTIEPGVSVIFMGYYAINVKGRILALGTSADSIRFTVVDTSGFSTDTHTAWAGIRFYQTPSTNDTSILDHCIIEYGRNTQGGGVFVREFNALKLSNSIILKCRANDGGGLFLYYCSNPVIINSTLSGNAAQNSGGGMSMIHCNPVITNSTISGNTADIYGGGMYLFFSNPVITNSTVSGNRVYSYSGGGVFIEYSSPVITNSTLSGNFAYSGGGMYVNHSNPVITNSTLNNNQAELNGGGMRVYDQSTPVITNTVLSENSAEFGGGIAMLDLCNPVITNSTLSGNTADVGGGIYAEDHCNPIITNSILWANTAPTNSGINQDATSAPGITYSNIQGGYSGTGNMNTDPLFADAANGDFRLLPCSPMINAGTPDTTGLGLPATDLFGQVRVMHDTVDIGAAEYNGPRNTIDLLSAQIEFCVDDAGVSLNGTPAGGSYSGAGVNGSAFFPAFAGPGQHWVYYQVGDSVACPTIDSILMTVYALPVVTHPNLEVCIDQPVLTLTGGLPAGGTYSGAYLSGNVFNVQVAGPGTHTLTYSYLDPVTGCYNSVSFTVTVHPLPVVDFPDPSPVCSGSGLLTLTATPAGGTFSGPYVAGGSFDATAAPVGSYTLYYHYTDGNGCSNVDSAVVTVLALPVPSISPDVSVCLGSCTQLQVGGGVSYLWSTAFTGSTWTVCPQQTSTYTVTVSSANGCTASAQVTVTVNPLPIADAGMNDTICPGESSSWMAAYAGAGASYSWSNGQAGQNINVSPAATTTYKLTVTSSQGCTATDQVMVVVRPAPVASIAPVLPVCPGECVVLTASGGVSYLWSDAGATASATATVCPEHTTTYTVTVTDINGCTAAATMVVNVHPQVMADAGLDQWICPGDCATLTATGGVSYLWSDAGATATASATVCPSVDTKYYVTVTSVQGCEDVDSVMVHLYTAPSFSISGTDTIQPGDTATMSAVVISGQAPFSYNWSPAGTLLGNGSASVQAVPPASLWYSLALTDGNGCSSTGQFLVTVAHPGASLAGRILYANAGQTPIAGATVFLLDQAKAIADSTVTDDRGYFWFNGLDTTNYTVYPALEGRWGWGGVNATDALLTAKHFAQLGLLNGVWLAAADVNANGGVNTTDAQLIAQRFAGKIGSFASGDWYFEQPLVAAGGDDPYAQWVELLSLNFGDVNGSNIPTAKATPKVWLQEEGMLSLEEEEEFESPVKVVEDLEIGSVSLVIHSLQAGLVRDIRMADGLEGILSWSVEGDELRIGWYSLEAVDMRAGSELFYLVFARESAGALAGLRLEVRDNSELSNGAGEVYAYQKLSYPELLIPAGANGNSLSIWPNPATATVNLQLSTAQSGQARIELLDAVGRSVKLVHSGALENGQHNWTLDVSGLPAGTYMLHTTGVSGVSTHKLIVVR